MQPRQYKQKAYVFGDGLFPRLSPTLDEDKETIKSINQVLAAASKQHRKEQKIELPPINRLNKQLVHAVNKGEKATALKLLAEGAEVNYVNGNGNSVLMMASFHGQIETVRGLLALGAKINHVNNKGNTAIIPSSQKGRTEVIRELLAQGAEINHVNKLGATALMAASYFGHTETVRALLACGAKVNLKNKRGNTALTLSSQQGKAEVVRELLAHGAEINCQNRKGETALQIAKNCHHTEVVDMIEEELAEQENYSVKRQEIESTFFGSYSKQGLFTKASATELPKVLVDIIKDYARPGRLDKK